MGIPAVSLLIVPIDVAEHFIQNPDRCKQLKIIIYKQNNRSTPDCASYDSYPLPYNDTKRKE